MEEKNVGILMKKFDLGNYFYLFVPDSVIEGNLMLSEELTSNNKPILYTDEGKEYYRIDDIDCIYSDSDEFYYNDITTIGLKEIYEEDKYTYDEMIAAYYEEYASTFYIGSHDIVKNEMILNELDINKMEIKNKNLDSKELITTFVNNLDDYLNKDNYAIFKKNVNTLLDKYDSIYDNYSLQRVERQHELEEVFESADLSDSEKILKLYNGVKKVVIGQDETIKTVISALDVDDYAKLPTQKNRCLIVGKTGTGKTEIFRTISNLTDRPFVRTDSTQITVAGYVGGSIENNVLIPLMQKANGNVKLAQNGIVALDEIDKKGSSSNDDVAGRGVLNSFLPFLDGTVFRFKYNNYMVDFDTSNLSVFALGAFTNVFEYSTKKNASIGFKSKSDIVDSSQIQIEDFIKIGMMPDEFIGRFPILSIMNDLTVSDYERILTESSNSQVLFYQNYFKDKYNVSFNYTDDYITEVAKKAIELKLGGRALKRIVEKSIFDARWDIQTGNGKYKELILDKESVENPKIYTLK